MRDIGIFIWVALLIVGVVGSMISSARKQMASAPRRPQGPQGRPVPPRLPVAPARPAPAPPPKPRPAAAARVEPPPEHSPPAHVTPIRRGIFADRRAMVQGVIAAEVLGKPRSLSDEYFPR